MFFLICVFHDGNMLQNAESCSQSAKSYNFIIDFILSNEVTVAPRVGAWIETNC